MRFVCSYWSLYISLLSLLPKRKGRQVSAQRKEVTVFLCEITRENHHQETRQSVLVATEASSDTPRPEPNATPSGVAH